MPGETAATGCSLLSWGLCAQDGAKFVAEKSKAEWGPGPTPPSSASGLPLSATPVLPDRFPTRPYLCANHRHSGKRGQQRRHRVNQILPGDFHACLYTRQEAI